MAFTQLNQLAIAFKKLAGKTHTNASFGASNESIGSNVQLGSSTLFGDVIPSSPTTTLWAITDGVVEKVRFELSSIATSQYAASAGGLSGTTIDDSGDGAPTAGAFSNGIHAYALKLTGSYETDSSNPDAGTTPFTNGYHLTGSNGALQIIPDSFGSDYIAQVRESDGTLIPPLDEIDYYLDPYAGILFVQDYDSGKIPTFVDAFIYTGEFVDDKIANVSSSLSNLSQNQLSTGSVTASLDVGATTFTVVSASNTFLTIGNDGEVTVAENLTVSGDLTINGTASFINTENLLVKDKFILLNSGSANPDVGGLVIDEGNHIGSAFVFSGSRWGYTSSFDSSGSNDVTPDAFASAIVIGDTITRYEELGNIRVSGSDIFIYGN